MPALLLLTLLLLSLPATAGELVVFTTIAPLKTLIKQIAGEQVRVSTLVPEGFDPHIYEPSPRQISELAKADLYVSIGMPFEKAWQSKLQQANPGMRFLDARLVPEEQDHATGHDHGYGIGRDPHIWTDPLLFATLVPVIVDAMVAIDQEQAAVYRGNGDQSIRDLQNIDETIRGIMTGLNGRSFLVVHPGWGHFASRYHLQQIALEHEGKVGGASHMAELIDLALSQSINTIFVQNRSETGIAEPLAAAINARIVVINPLAADYRKSLLNAAEEIAKSLKK